MFRNTKAYSGFSVDSIARAKAFYEQTLDLPVSEVPGRPGLMTIHLTDGRDLLVYEKTDHTPATFTALFFAVRDVPAAVDELMSRGVSCERYEGFDQDDKGVARGPGPTIAWFTDPAGNVLSVLERD